MHVVHGRGVREFPAARMTLHDLLGDAIAIFVGILAGALVAAAL